MKQKERIELAEWVLNYSIKCGVDQVAVSLSNSRRIEIEYRDRKLEKLKESKFYYRMRKYPVECL